MIDDSASPRYTLNFVKFRVYLFHKIVSYIFITNNLESGVLTGDPLYVEGGIVQETDHSDRLQHEGSPEEDG